MGTLVSVVVMAAMAGAERAAAPDLSSAPVNAWVRVEESKTGGRASPMLFYVPDLKRFVLAGGVPLGEQHFVVEEFDLFTGTWINAYPKAAPAEYAPETGPTKAPEHPPRGWPGKGRTVVDAKGASRIGFFGAAYNADSRAHFQYAYHPESKRLLAYLWNMTLSYDPVARVWTDLKAKPSPADNDSVLPGGHTEMIWGSLCCDPVNKEVVSVGGTAAVKGGSPGTWAYSVADNTWRRLGFASGRVNRYRTYTEKIKHEAWALIGALRNRFHVTETEEEAKVDLQLRARHLLSEIYIIRDNMAGALTGKPDEAERGLLSRAWVDADKAGAALRPITEKLQGAVTAETIASVQAAYDHLDRAMGAFAVEPPGRALSQMAYDAASQKIVLFGGDGLDRHYADTWVYDCKTRTWQQCYPKLSPSPRAGHALVYLPKSKRVLLIGGYGLGNGHSYMYGDVYRSIPFEMWVYDTAANEWTLLLHLPVPKGREPAPNTPEGDYRGPWPAAVNEDDTVVLFQAGSRGRATWVCKVDPTKVDTEGTAKHGVPSGTAAFRGDETEPRPGYRSYDPSFYERGVTPDPGAAEATFKNLPVNTWQLIEPPKGVDKCGWGTTAYDADRQQFLFWGGGHSEYKGTNVFHYSIRTNLWSSSCRPDWVLEWSGGFLCPALLSFRNRPHIPVHAYQTYAYDPPSGLMVAVRGTTFLYNVAEREWEFPPIKTPFLGGVMDVSLETTPGGVVCWAETQRNSDNAGLFLFDGKARTWKPLPRTGANFPRPWCDGSGMCYDAKRDCLWLAPGKTIFRYDIETGTVTRIETAVPEVLGKFALWREQVYLPEADLILLMRLFTAPDGRLKNIAYDPTADKWYWIDLPFAEGGKPRTFEKNPFSWTGALFHDAKRKVALLHNPITVWALRFDRETAKMTEVSAAQ